jgi:transglutaminase-like putative cysteine protease
MIYDVRQTTVCVYASPVAHAHHVLRLMPINRSGQRVQVASLQIAPEPQHRREGEDFFGNRLTWIDVEEPHDTLTVKLTARVSVDAVIEPEPRRRRRGRPSARKPSRPATSGHCRRRIFCFEAA